ncbi:MAG TPA: hypothetical protein VFF09_00630 [archaeon]|nr:hypothetical protein [archaeon]
MKARGVKPTTKKPAHALRQFEIDMAARNLRFSAGKSLRLITRLQVSDYCRSNKLSLDETKAVIEALNNAGAKISLD